MVYICLLLSVVVVLWFYVVVGHPKNKNVQQNKKSGSNSQILSWGPLELFRCIENNDYETFVSLFNSAVLVYNIQNEKADYDVLFYAVLRGRHKIVDFLVEKELEIENRLGDVIDINRHSRFLNKGVDGVTPLQAALIMGNVQIVRILLKSKKLKIHKLTKRYESLAKLAVYAICEQFNIEQVSKCLELVILDRRCDFIDGSDFNLVIDEAVLNNLNNLINAYKTKIGVIYSPILLNIFGDILDGINSSNVEKETKLNALKLMCLLCEKDVRYFTKIINILKRYDFSCNDAHDEYLKAKEELGEDMYYVHLLAARCLGYTTQKNPLAVSPENDMITLFIECLFTREVKYIESYKDLKTRIIELGKDDDFCEDCKIIVKYLDTIFALCENPYWKRDGVKIDANVLYAEMVSLDIYKW